MTQQWGIRPSSTTADLLGVHVWSERRAICVGKDGACLWWDGRNWTTAELPIQEDLYAVWGPEPGEVFAVGGNLHVGGQSKVCHFSHGKWTVRPSGIQSLLLAVSGSAADVMAVGFNGGVVKRVDDRFEEASADTNDHLFDIHAVGDGSWWVVGLNGTLKQHSQGRWLAHHVTVAHLNGVCFNSDVEGVAVAHNGEVLCYVSGSWTVRRPEPATCLYGVCSTGWGSYLAVGIAGLILEGSSREEWRIVKSPTTVPLHAVSSCDGLAIAVGANGVVVHSGRP